MTFDPLLTEQPTGDDGPAPAPIARRTAVGAPLSPWRVGAVAALVAFLVVNLVGGGDDAAADGPPSARRPRWRRLAPGVRSGRARRRRSPRPTRRWRRPRRARPVPPTTTPAARRCPSIDAPGSLWWLVNRDRPLPDGYVPPDLVVPNVPTAAGRRCDPALCGDGGGVRGDARRRGDRRPPTAAEERLSLRERPAGAVRPLRQGLRPAMSPPRWRRRPAPASTRPGWPSTSGSSASPTTRSSVGRRPASGWPTTPTGSASSSATRRPRRRITGYANEPWHLRYVGVDLATVLHYNGLTMEEQFGVGPVGG